MDESLKQSCIALENFLKHEGDNYIDAIYLILDLQLLRNSVPGILTKSIEVLGYITSVHHGFPNAWVAC